MEVFKPLFPGRIHCNVATKFEFEEVWLEMKFLSALTGTNSQYFSWSQTGGLLVFFDRGFIEQDKRKDWISVLAPLVGGSSLFMSQWYKRASKHSIFRTCMGTQRLYIQEYRHFSDSETVFMGCLKGWKATIDLGKLQFSKSLGIAPIFWRPSHCRHFQLNAKSSPQQQSKFFNFDVAPALIF